MVQTCSTPGDADVVILDGHLALYCDELRAVMEERWWENATEVGKRVRDLSVFRLVSNFVREKRLAGD